MTPMCSTQASDSCLGRSGLKASALVLPQNIHDAWPDRLTVFDRCLDGIDGMLGAASLKALFPSLINPEIQRFFAEGSSGFPVFRLVPQTISA